MILQEIPLSGGVSDQSLNVTIENNPYTFRVLWNERFQYWSLSISDLMGSPILENIKMVINYPLTSRFQRLNLDGDFYFVDRSGKSDRPTFDSLGGVTYGLFYYNEQLPKVYPKPIAPRV